jgi:hypothetical protein
MGNENKGFASHPENINREGRPKKGETLTDALREFAEQQDVEYNDNKISRKQALSQKLWQMALNGDLQAMKYIYDRIDGKPTEKHEVEGNMPTVIFSGIDEPE